MFHLLVGNRARHLTSSNTGVYLKFWLTLVGQKWSNSDSLFSKSGSYIESIWFLVPLFFSPFYVPVYDGQDFTLVGYNVWFSNNLTETQIVLYGNWSSGSSHHGQLFLIGLISEALLHPLDTLDPSVGQDAVNVLDKKLCSTRFAVDGAIYDFLWQTDVLLHKKFFNLGPVWLLGRQRCSIFIWVHMEILWEVPGKYFCH